MNKGKLLAHYRMVKKIGSGGMGEVYLAEDTRLDRKVAIKFLNEGFSQDSEELKRFIQEAKAASALNHPHIITVYDVGEVDGKNYISTELIEGKTLRECLYAKKALELSNILTITVQVCEALSAAHQAGIIHRDIKPENIMIRKDGYAKVLDFGLAKLSEPDATGPEASTRLLFKTAPGTVMGTASYMSPEQARGKAVDHRTDIFSIGVVLYELVTRRQPFLGETSHHTMVAILEKDPPPMAGPGVSVPVELERITFRALEKKLDRRYQKITELITDLKKLRNRLEFEAEVERSSIPDKTQTLTRAYQVDTDSYPGYGNTIAVLPFVNMSRNEDGDYFSDGLAEELLNVLSKIRGLRVAARTSAFSFKGKQST
ncbi:MAG TPA: protein kinase, partial [Pyrinomonadaceae bacterium]|nr:protein kinase [Pyrinomonadaceae bacterium]